MEETSFLATRQGKLTLLFLCGVGMLDFIDASIVNVALPSIRAHLHFSVQNLQWVLSAYLLTYGGFMLLGGRAADLLGLVWGAGEGLMGIGRNEVAFWDATTGALRARHTMVAPPGFAGPPMDLGPYLGEVRVLPIPVEDG